MEWRRFVSWNLWRLVFGSLWVRRPHWNDWAYSNEPRCVSIKLNDDFSQQLLITGNYSRLSVSFSFKRMPGYYIRQVYIPCTMIVILSWITFWLNRRAFNVRLMICALSLLILTIGLNIVGLEIPKTSYTKAIDVFTGVCMTFTFIALVGKLSSLLLKLWRWLIVLIVFAYLSNTAADSEKDFPLKVDKFFRIAFPVVFVIFNVLYWTIYWRFLKNISTSETAFYLLLGISKLMDFLQRVIVTSLKLRRKLSFFIN